MSDTKKKLKRVCDAINDKKGLDIALLDVHEIASFTTYLVICDGGNRKQTQAICDAVMQAMKEEKLSPAHVEGYSEAQWILVDYLEFVVHIFTTDTREFYGLERLWGDGIRVELQALTA